MSLTEYVSSVYVVPSMEVICLDGKCNFIAYEDMEVICFDDPGIQVFEF